MSASVCTHTSVRGPSPQDAHATGQVPSCLSTALPQARTGPDSQDGRLFPPSRLLVPCTAGERALRSKVTCHWGAAVSPAQSAHHHIAAQASGSQTEKEQLPQKRGDAALGSLPVGPQHPAYPEARHLGCVTGRGVRDRGHTLVSALALTDLLRSPGSWGPRVFPQIRVLPREWEPRSMGFVGTQAGAAPPSMGSDSGGGKDLLPRHVPRSRELARRTTGLRDTWCPLDPAPRAPAMGRGEEPTG